MLRKHVDKKIGFRLPLTPEQITFFERVDKKCELLLQEHNIKKKYQSTMKQTDQETVVKVNILLKEGYKQTKIIIADGDNIIRGAGNEFLKVHIAASNLKTWNVVCVINISSIWDAPIGMGVQVNAKEIIFEKSSESDVYFETDDDIRTALGAHQ